MSEAEIMRVALSLAARGLGRTAPNPTVGCVVVAPDGKILGQARTADAGRPHAETQALAQAGENAAGSTAAPAAPAWCATDSSLQFYGAARSSIAPGPRRPQATKAQAPAARVPLGE